MATSKKQRIRLLVGGLFEKALQGLETQFLPTTLAEAARICEQKAEDFQARSFRQQARAEVMEKREDLITAGEAMQLAGRYQKISRAMEDRAQELRVMAKEAEKRLVQLEDAEDTQEIAQMLVSIQTPTSHYTRLLEGLELESEIEARTAELMMDALDDEEDEETTRHP